MSACFLMSCRARALACAAAAASVAIAFAVPAAAANKVRYVSTTGNDANNCTMANPCRTLQRGLNRTPVGGELRILDSGDYGESGKVKKSLTIAGNGHTVAIANPITVMTADAVVVLRGLVLDGQGTTTSGILVEQAAEVHIERCVVHGFTQFGIRASTDGASLFVSDSVSRNNINGLSMSGASRLTIDNSRFQNNGNQGVSISSGIATIHRSISSGNVSNGFSLFQAIVSVVSTVAAQNDSAGFSVQGGTVTVESSLAHDNFAGLTVFGGGTARISRSTFTGNQTGLSINAFSTLETLGNNTVLGNTDNVDGTPTPVNLM